MKRVVLAMVVMAGLLAACESVGVGVGIGVPIGSRGGLGVSVGGTVPLPAAKPPQAPASAASAP